MTDVLPVPARARWQPLRAGLVDLFYYDHEEFRFRDGRLLLRGNNGTGKSKVLALMLPFLLDGELSPHRVEPDADPKKRMEWNLLLGGAHPHPERLGYTWLEFGRVSEDGTAEYRTIGCGLKAVSGRGIARHWFFVTSQRIGQDLSLVDATTTALARDRLADALGEHGTVYDRAREYRRAVDEALFGLGEQRYAALVDLLINLRAPQLSKRPNEKALSSALTEALPPLDQAIIADVAEAFRSLEEDRDALRAMTEARDAAESFLGHYRRYARVASRRRAAQPRNAQSNYERVNRELTAAQEAHEQAQQALDAAEEQLDQLEQHAARLRAREEALRASPEMRSARELKRVAQEAHRLRREAGRLAEEAARAADTVGYRTRLAGDAAAVLQEAAEALEGCRTLATEAARAALLDEAVLTDRVEAERAAERQHRAVRHVDGLIASVEEARTKLEQARLRVDELAAEADALADRRSEAAEAVQEQGRALVAAAHRHLAATVELRAEVPSELDLWVETLDGPNPVRTAVDAAGHTASAALADAEADTRTRESTARRRVADLDDEITKLEAGENSLPPVPHTRGASRDDRPGTPLWQLIDFAEELTTEERAGLEAALEGAGMLDAWVTPDGELVSPDTEDVFLRAAEVEPANLTSVLRADERVSAILATIGVGGGKNWVDLTGRFRTGVLEGAWHKPAAEFIGRSAREAARLARLAELRAELLVVQDELAALAAEQSTLRERRATLASEIAACPDDAGLRKAHAAVHAIDGEQHRLAERRRIAEEKRADAHTAFNATEHRLVEEAAEVGLPATRGELKAVSEALARYLVALASLWPAQRRHSDAIRDDERARGELASASEDHASRQAQAAEAALASEAATEHHETLAATVGSAVAELQRRLTEVADALRQCGDDRKAADGRRTDALTNRGKAEGQLDTLRTQLDEATASRAEAAESLRRFATTGLLRVALPDLATPDPAAQWAPDPTVRLARSIDRELAEQADDDQVWERVQRKVNDELKTLTDTLSRHGNSATARLLDDGIVVDVLFQGRTTSTPDLTDALRVEVADRGRILDEREREILENHLVNEVASTLQELIFAADEQVARMNAELDDRPTSTGMRLRLRWVPVEDGPTGLATARERLLRQTSDAWSDEDRSAVGEFLQAEIANVRSRNASGTWLEHLTEALDYRRWHRFVIQRHQNGQWRTAIGPASGGERVLTASVPLFAAASSHYASAGNPHAPRLVTLDEAFAGVDDDSRAKCMGLLAAFDLDVVMTSEREWGCYPEVPGLAIAQLSRTDDIPAVLVTPWEWTGQRRIRVAAG
ncbi:TIGR02680 family protein [Lentzea sp. DG1S-22]|uniref:TIGR02680 family protein n=1 Tax=Lentzea sp. DG1S-22 TaxID=3108822 RepID=UPI002E76C129|nr:TIGR02680 family protein [Lentzea sp. DG1S-22]WVH77715.1 TIGR02680 family protein [Lentzea sp. DG1S-22]